MRTLDNLSRGQERRSNVRVLLDGARLRVDHDDGAWRHLWDEFAAGQSEGEGGGGGSASASSSATCIILHVPRHYSLLFGLRTYTTTDGRHVREVLSARRKQKPKEWLDLDDYLVPLMTGEGTDRCQFISVRRAK